MARQGRPLMEQLTDVIDPRQHGKIKFKLNDVLAMAICAIVCGCDNYVEIEYFVRAQAPWFRKFMEIEHLPTRYTFRRIFMIIDAAAIERLFSSWVAESYGALADGEQVCIDGKTVCGSRSKKHGNKAVHHVSAWAAKGGYVFGQLKTADKSNEITAIPALLDMLFLKGCIISIDAAGCQKDIAAAIVAKKANYLLALKGNQSALHDDIRLFFGDTIKHGNPDYPLAVHEATDGDHGRIETRRLYVTGDISWLAEACKWAGLKSIACLVSTREIDGVRSVEHRY